MKQIKENYEKELENYMKSSTKAKAPKVVTVSGTAGKTGL